MIDTITMRARAKGYESFDIALPVDWVHEAKLMTNTSPVGHVVWVYKYKDYKSNFGKPMPIDDIGDVIVHKMNKQEV